MRKINITAHAGCLNTKLDSIESVKKAIEIKADYAEVDVNCRIDEIAVLKHDEILEKDKDLILLKDIFNLIKHENIKLNLDIKNKRALDNIEKEAKELGVVDKIVLTGVDEHDTLVLQKRNYAIKYLMNIEIEEVVKDELIERYIKYAINSDSVGVNIDYRYCTKELIEEAHKNNLMVSVWTVDKIEEIKRFKELGVDNITTNNPNLAL